MLDSHTTPTKIVHDDAADLRNAEARLMSDLFWMGRLIAPDPCPVCGRTDPCLVCAEPEVSSSDDG
jgi:hypothetical protein